MVLILLEYFRGFVMGCGSVVLLSGNVYIVGF